MIMIIKFIFNFCNFSVIVCFFNQITNARYFIFNAVFVAKLLTSGNLFSNSVIFVFLTRLLTSGIFFSSFVSIILVFDKKSQVSILSTFATNLSRTVFLTTSFFNKSPSLLKSTGTGANV